MPVWQNEQSMLFGDFRFKADDQNSHEGNFGLGFRKMLDGGWSAGVYGFYDHRRSPNANLFDQLTFGAELLGTNFDVRANTYWPIGNVQQAVGGPVTPQSTASVSGSGLQVFTPATMQTMEFALRGFDAEAGVRVPITPAESPYNFRFYAGGFRFDEPTGVAQIIAGPRLRLEFTDYQVPGLWNGTRFTVGAEWQTDEVRGSQFFAGLRLRVPLQGESRRSSFTMQERRMTDTIIRDVDIVANAQSIQVAPSISESATTTANGQTITVLTTSNTTGANLPTAITTAGANSTVILSGSFTTNSNSTGVVTLQSGQTVMGSGTLGLRTASGRTVTANLSNSASITGNVGNANYTIQMANSSTLTGLTINNTNSNGAANALGIRANNVSDATISNNVITATETSTGPAHGIDIIGTSTNVLVTGNTITATTAGGGNAIAVQVNDPSHPSATISNNTLSASGGTTENAVVDLSHANILSGSTNNVKSRGNCVVSSAGVGTTVGFTDGTTCGP